MHFFYKLLADFTYSWVLTFLHQNKCIFLFCFLETPHITERKKEKEVYSSKPRQKHRFQYYPSTCGIPLSLQDMISLILRMRKLKCCYIRSHAQRHTASAALGFPARQAWDSKPMFWHHTSPENNFGSCLHTELQTPVSKLIKYPFRTTDTGFEE